MAPPWLRTAASGRRVGVLRRYRPWQENHEECIRAALTLPSTTKKKLRNKKLNCLRNKTKRSWDGDTVKWDVLEAVGGGREILSNIW